MARGGPRDPAAAPAAGDTGGRRSNSSRSGEACVARADPNESETNMDVQKEIVDDIPLDSFPKTVTNISDSAMCREVLSVENNTRTPTCDTSERDGSGGSDRTTEEGGQGSGTALERALLQLGPFGLYQQYTALLLVLPNLLAAMYSLNYVFVADQVAFRCLVPECEGSGAAFDNDTVLALLPADRCRRRAPLPARPGCGPEHFHPNETVPCEAFVYETVDTVYAEFDMACDEWRRTLVGTVRNAALPLALLLTGYLSDRHGRRCALCVLAACAGALGLAKSFAPHYRAYLALEFLEAALGYGFNSAAYVMMVELARPSLRAAFAGATGAGYGLGGMLFALAASRERYWRRLLRAVHAPALLLPLYWLLLDESTRWLHAAGRQQHALRNIRKAARWNKVTVDEDLLRAVAGDAPAEDGRPPGNPWLPLLRSRVLMLRFAVCCWCWAAVSFVYYGLTINSVLLSGDKYVNFALNMAMEVVASVLIVLALERFGRRRCMLAAFLACGLACVVPFFVAHAGAGLGTFFAGKLSATFAFNSLYVFTAELFPTDARSSALAAASLAGRAGSVLAPQTPLLSVPLQALLYGGCALSAALLVLLVPETRRAPLPQRARHAEGLRAPADAARTSRQD